MLSLSFARIVGLGCARTSNHSVLLWSVYTEVRLSATVSHMSCAILAHYSINQVIYCARNDVILESELMP